MKERLKQIRNSQKLNQSKFAEALGVSVSNIQSYEIGRRVPSDSFIQLICNKYGVNETWLRTGEGEMLSPKTREQEIAEITASIIKENNPIRIALDKVVHKLTDDQLENVLQIAKDLLEEVEKEKDIPE